MHANSILNYIVLWSFSHNYITLLFIPQIVLTIAVKQMVTVQSGAMLSESKGCSGQIDSKKNGVAKQLSTDSCLRIHVHAQSVRFHKTLWSVSKLSRTCHGPAIAERAPCLFYKWPPDPGVPSYPSRTTRHMLFHLSLSYESPKSCIDDSLCPNIR